MSSDHWAVLGGDRPRVYKVQRVSDFSPLHFAPRSTTSSLVYSLFITCGFRTEPFPLAIKCTSKSQAERALSRLQQTLQAIPSNASLVTVAGAFFTSPVVSNVLDESVKRFYVVVTGRQLGIFLTWCLFQKLKTLNEAIEFLITKAHRLGNATDHSSLLQLVLLMAGATIGSDGVNVSSVSSSSSGSTTRSMSGKITPAPPGLGADLTHGDGLVGCLLSFNQAPQII
ncbi:hypothetical protein JVT61DRAFT_1405 [Boletus reticuloceps]|uniref:Uncharacterized protein n=1 Tax=Boletus reticuloceps TaxID=495285 RepID=A0A8I2YC81_9AGAM|nr:hypothetical protein JVT61DRAFT_1405 [Boletus reticuloceps]